ncbi:acyl thioesterase ii [Fusarium beomiforme]|uniref:Acyl thioesterase ii n=1 Tax=Fusarium beomiforme TaxID=44412 RepID=A0A9P5A768_9HYPO|nr:acyl thioesterase ii [Fusarium beomiforme]
MAAHNLTHTHGTTVSSEAVTEMLLTSWNEVYRASPDGEKYTSPQCLNGTPVSKITETGEYWMSRWYSLESFLAQESSEEEKKRETKERCLLDPGNKALAKAHKFHMDNVSKHRKIREMFGPDSTYHPNQLVSKHHLPTEGMCEKELMYKLACKVSDLRVLRLKGELAMDPWDFLRWRVAKKMQSMFTMSAQSGRDIIKRIVHSICDASGPNSSSRQYEDPLLRAAIIRSAGYQGRLASFHKPVDKDRKGKTTLSGMRHIGQGRPQIEPVSTTRQPQVNTSRVEKRVKRSSQPSTYGGVSAYRAQ